MRSGDFSAAAEISGVSTLEEALRPPPPPADKRDAITENSAAAELFAVGALVCLS